MENEKQKLISVGALFSQTWKIYTGNFKKFSLMVLFSLIGFVPLIIIVSAFDLLGGSSGVSMSIVKVILGFLGVASACFYIYWFVSAWAGIFLLVKDPSKKIKEAFIFGRSNFWKYLGVSILVAVITMLWSMLLYIPGIIFAFFYIFSAYALFFEDFKRMSALRRSKELVSGYWWAVFGRILLGLLVIVGIYIAYSIVMSLPVIMLSKSSYAMEVWNEVFAGLNIVISFFFVYVVFVIFPYLIYQDLVRIKPESKVDRAKTGNAGLIVAVVVLAIAIPFFATLTVVALNDARIKSRDAERIANGKQIQTALELFVNDKGACPEKLNDLVVNRYIGSVTDPISKDEYGYEITANKDCQVCINLEGEMGGLAAGKNCFKAVLDNVESPVNGASTTPENAFNE